MLGLMGLGLLYLLLRPSPIVHSEEEPPLDRATLHKIGICVVLLLVFAGTFESVGFILGSVLVGIPMARLYGVALSLSAWSSFIGALIATCGMVLFAPLLAKWAIAFGPAEYFVLLVFAIVCLGGMAGDRPLKTFFAALIGLFLSSVGIDANSGVYRFTGDNIHLTDGIQFVVLVLGLFSISEILLLLEKTHRGQEAVKATGRMMFNFEEAASVFTVNIRCGLLGFIMGVLPGASGTFGQGDKRGLAAPNWALVPVIAIITAIGVYAVHGGGLGTDGDHATDAAGTQLAQAFGATPHAGGCLIKEHGRATAQFQSVKKT